MSPLFQIDYIGHPLHLIVHLKFMHCLRMAQQCVAINKINVYQWYDSKYVYIYER